MTHGSLFSGIGGFDLAAAWAGWTNVFNCEIDPFCRRVLKYHFPESEHMKTYEQQTLPFGATASTCSPAVSRASRSASRANARVRPTTATSGPQCSELFGPRWVVGENVLGIVNWSQGMVFEQVCADLEAAGYEVQAYLIPAAGVGAPHLRYRTWFVAHRGDARAESSWQERFGAIVAGDASDTGRVGLRERACEQELVEGCIRAADARACSADGAVVDADGLRCEKQFVSSQSCEAEERSRPRRHDFASVPNWEGFPTESPICGPDDGLSAGLDGITFPAWRRESIKAYGNTIVPQVALRIFETINEYEKQ